MPNEYLNPFEALADLIEGTLDNNVVTFRKSANGIQEAGSTEATEGRSGEHREAKRASGSGPKLADTFKPRKQPKPAARAEGTEAEDSEDGSDSDDTK